MRLLFILLFLFIGYNSMSQTEEQSYSVLKTLEDVQIREYDPVSVPAIVFTEPEIISVGMSPEEGKEYCEKLNTTLLTGKFPLAANGRSLTMEAEKTGGFVRVIAREDNHQILGIQAVGSSVSELSGEFSLALEMGALLEDIAGTIHAHPTMSEAFHEAVLATLGHAIHIS